MVLQQKILIGIALSPAIALVLTPDTVIDGLLASVGPATVLGGSWLVAFGAAHVARRLSRTFSERKAPLMHGGRASSIETPPESDQRGDIARILRSPPPGRALTGTPEPELPEHALAGVIGRVLGSWGKHDAQDLSPEELRELWLLVEIVTASPDRAGDLARSFLKPDVVLDIRDRIADVARRREAYDRQLGAFRATQAVWTGVASGAHPAPLRTALKALTEPDPDLFHHVIVAHDPTDAAQATAALWCARHPACERASVAQFLSDIATAGRLEAAAERGDIAWLAGVLEVIETWNAGQYKGRELGLSPADAVSDKAPVLSRALDRLSTLQHRPRWPMPRGLFAEYPGRAARDRDHWDLATGRVSRAPSIADYIDADDRHAA